ncbi:tRNA methyltransferase complex GCD14 subunit-domain-containing protein [Lipomyces arxii]|uniref:tRNA methyltransferase complex GCD14 subunit-domain-containing protein n=1 Tax=Lipomyces arxii TaxID=56418 RepID=UPI0034CE3E2F
MSSYVDMEPAAETAVAQEVEAVKELSPFLRFQRPIEEGALVLAWLTRDNTKPLRPEAGSALHTRFGSFQHDDMINARYGKQLPSSSSTQAGFIHLLHPTPELWSMSLPHRTQIVYTPDASYIVQRLRIRPGSRIIEAGTGSASFTHALARTVNTTGRVWTFEFHEPRYEMAKKEIEEHGLADVVKCSHGDVCTNGFKPDCDEVLDASAVFLDLPAPWLAIPHLDGVVTRKKITRICCFSPCMEQVQRTIEALQKTGWQDIEMVEVSCKRWEARKEMVRRPEDAIARLRDIKRRRIEGLKKRNNRKKEEYERIKSEASSALTDDPTSGSESTAPPSQNFDSLQEPVLPHIPEKPFLAAEYNPWGKGKRVHEGEDGYEWKELSKVELELKTHTSYLTFAFLPPVMEQPTTASE